MKEMNPAFRRKMERVGIIIISWIGVGFMIAFYDFFAFNSRFVDSLAASYNLGTTLIFNIAAAILGALAGSVVLVFYVNEKYRNKPYWQSITLVVCSFFLIIGLIVLILTTVYASVMSGGIALTAEWKNLFRESVFDTMHIKNIMIWGIVVALTQFFLQVSDKFGQGVLWNVIKGKYHTPRPEKRVFMFVDLTSSTTIAEKLGNEMYHQLLKDFFADITNPVLENKGEIYQYVGDEMVISWSFLNGVENNHCLNCYFDMRQTISDLRDKYMERYHLVPEFKAGLHYGQVIAGEIGIIKRDITFSGDVLNTTSRIQGKCNEYKVKLLVSDSLLNELNWQPVFARYSLGAIELKGKGEQVALSTIEKSTA